MSRTRSFHYYFFFFFVSCTCRSTSFPSIPNNIFRLLNTKTHTRKKTPEYALSFFFHLFRISFHLNFVPSCSSRLNKMRNEIRVNMRTSIEHTHSSQCSGVGVEPVSITHGYCQKSPFFNIFKAKNNKERLLFESKLIADHIANVQSCGNCL